MKRGAFLLILVVLATFSARAYATGCDDTPSGYECNVGDDGGGSGGGPSGGGPSGSSGGSNSEPYEYTTGPHGDCVDPGGDYQEYQRWRYDPETGQHEYLYSYCDMPSSSDPSGGNAPPPPPPPPSAWEVSDSFERQIPSPMMGVNPDRRGLTGLETRLWASGPTSVSGSLSIRGYSVTASAGPTQYKWIMGDGSVYYTSHPGSRDAPAVRHTYETKDLYTLVLEVTWSGSYSWSGFGQSGGGSLGPWTRSDSRAYRVVEVRSVLRR